MAPPSHATASLRESSSLVAHECDEGVLVFDEMHGKTSLVNHQGALVLGTLRSSQRVNETMLRTVLGMNNEDDDVEFQALIASLENSGLIVRC